MKVFVLIPFIATGGAEFAAVRLVKDLRRTGTDIRLVEIDRLVGPKPRLRLLRKLLSIRAMLKDGRPDVVVCFMGHVTILTFLAALGLRLRLIGCERSNPFSSNYSRFFRYSLKFTYCSVDSVLVQTEALKRQMQEQWGISHVRVVPNYIDSPGTSNATSTKSKKYRLITVGRLISSKNTELVVKSFQRIAKGNWELKIFGSGPEEKSIRRLIGKDERISIVSNVSNPNNIYQGADLLVFLSEIEGFPNVLIEAGAYGVPILAYDCDYGPSEILALGSCGKLIKNLIAETIDDAISKLIDDEKLRHRLAKKMRHRVTKDYATFTVIQKWREVLGDA